MEEEAPEHYKEMVIAKLAGLTEAELREVIDFIEYLKARRKRRAREIEEGKCHFCEGQLEERLVEFDGRWGQKRIVIRDVPAQVCVRCREQYFIPEVSMRLEELAKLEGVPDEGFVEVSVRKYRIV